MNSPQDRNAPDRSVHVQAASQRPASSSSSPSDTRSNAASGLTQQGLANQRPQGERHDASSEMQPGSSRDGQLGQQGPLGTSPQGERGARDPSLPAPPTERNPAAGRERR